MKSVRLPETDLANLAFRSAEHKAKFLANWLRPKQPRGSYGPFRRSISEAANVGLPLFPDMEPTTLDQLEGLVLAACKGDAKLIGMNLPPVTAVRTFMDSMNAQADYIVDLPLTLAPGMRYSYWLPMIVRYGGAARIVFLDLRRTGRLQATGMHTCFSIMHERFRALDPDFASVRFEAWRFANNNERTISVVHEWAAPIPFEQIVQDVAQTYAILNALRAGDAKPKSGSGGGMLF